MADPLGRDPDSFFRRLDTTPLTRTRRGVVILLVVFSVVLGVVGLTTWAVARGAFFPAAPKTTRASRTHVVRTHGWGGVYIGPGAGRSHFGGGGRIH